MIAKAMNKWNSLYYLLFFVHVIKLSLHKIIREYIIIPWKLQVLTKYWLSLSPMLQFGGEIGRNESNQER